MSATPKMIAPSPQAQNLCNRFLGWQCRVRQHAMRAGQGRPDAGMMPMLRLGESGRELGAIITVFNKAPLYALTPELRHIAKSSHDPHQRRERALALLAATYYQKPHEFSDTLTSSFQPNSLMAEAIISAKNVELAFVAYGQEFTIPCRVLRLGADDFFYQATWWHNYLFNPNLSGEAVILGFEPDWEGAHANPALE